MSDSNRTLLIVDDEPRISASLERMLRKEGYTIHTAPSGREGLNILASHDVGVVLSDFMMPEMDGVAFLEKAKQQKPDLVEILITGHATLENAVSAINNLHLYGYVKKPWDMEDLKATLSRAFEHYNLVIQNRKLTEITVEQNQKLKKLNEDLEELVRLRTLLLDEAVQEGITMLATAAETKDDDTGAHIYRILDITLDICNGLGLSATEVDKISRFSILHDVGKIHVPDSILAKPGKLTDNEWKVMRNHTLAGEKILGVSPFYQIARQIARSHHENWDGSGYPDGLSAAAIPLPARIVALADVFDALTHKRPYKDAWNMERALLEMTNLSGNKFDPDILAVFMEIRRKKAERKGTRKNMPIDHHSGIPSETDDYGR
ncbi:MAG: response regulator [Desulfobacteraceae bacterium]|nr:MAG: response regulator [Desulfobacteraceae bacterium]